MCQSLAAARSTRLAMARRPLAWQGGEQRPGRAQEVAQSAAQRLAVEVPMLLAHQDARPFEVFEAVGVVEERLPPGEPSFVGYVRGLAGVEQYRPVWMVNEVGVDR